MLVLCLPSRGASPYDGDEQDDGCDPHKDPFESMEHRSCHRVFRIGEITFEIRAADRRQCDKDKCRDGGDCDAKGVQRTALGFLCSCELVVQHFELFGERLQALGFGCGYGLAHRRAHRGVEYLSDGDEHLSVGHGEAAIPFGNRLPHHVQLERELLLGQAFRFPEELDVFVQDNVSLLMPDSYVTAMLSADGPLSRATGCNIDEDCLSSHGMQAAETRYEDGRLPLRSVFETRARFFVI